MSNPFIPFEGPAPKDFNAWLRQSSEVERSALATIQFVAEPSDWHSMLANLQAKYSAIVYAAGEAAAFKALGAISSRRLSLLNAIFFAAQARGCDIEFDDKKKVLTLGKWGARVEVLVRRMRHPSSRDTPEPLEILITAPAHFSRSIRDGAGHHVEDRLSHVFLALYESVKDQCTVTYEERLQKWQTSQDRWRAAIEQGKRQRAESAGRRRAQKVAKDLVKEEQRAELARILDDFRARGFLLEPANVGQPQPQSTKPDALRRDSEGHGDMPSLASTPVRPRDQQELIDEATDYRQSQLVRKYLLALNAKTQSGRAWMLWATSLADALCPVARRNAKLAEDSPTS
jgi:hypothetical protein